MRAWIALSLALSSSLVAEPLSRPWKVDDHHARTIFTFETDRFWLNLHHFLYVLGRAETGAPDSKREAVAGAPRDQERGLVTLTPEERAAWRKAVQFYASGPSTRDLVFDRDAVGVTHALLGAGDGRLSATGPLAAHAPHLDAVAPLYRKAWWPAHRAANDTWVEHTKALVEKHGDAVLRFVERAYGMTWREGGYAVRVSGYANWAGAYSTSGDLLVVSSLAEGHRGLHGLEAAFHEAMHQWDGEMANLLRRLAEKQGIPGVPEWLDHAVLFYTAGAAVGSVAPEYRTLGETAGIWMRGGKPFKPLLDEVWAPYLRGTGTRDDALSALLLRTRDIR